MKAENKTRPTRASVAGFLKKTTTGQQLADSRELVKLFREVAGAPPKMWGPSIVGFGRYHYVYESGREGDAPLLAFSPRKPLLVLYLAPYLGGRGRKNQLGRHKAGAGCVYIKSLDDIDRGALKKMAVASVKVLRNRYG